MRTELMTPTYYEFGGNTYRVIPITDEVEVLGWNGWEESKMFVDELALIQNGAKQVRAI